jgi:hypothetical protein
MIFSVQEVTKKCGAIELRRLFVEEVRRNVASGVQVWCAATIGESRHT